MGKDYCEICKNGEEDGSLELYAYKHVIDHAKDDVGIRKCICWTCAKKIEEFIESIS